MNCLQIHFHGYHTGLSFFLTFRCQTFRLRALRCVILYQNMLSRLIQYLWHALVAHTSIQCLLNTHLLCAFSLFVEAVALNAMLAVLFVT